MNDLRQEFPELLKDCWDISINDGWLDLIRPILDAMSAAPYKIKFNIQQIKQKFGGLRFYYDVSPVDNMPDDEYSILENIIINIDNLIKEAEDKSYTTCEVCGKPAKTVGKYWLVTLCEEHESLLQN